MISLVTAAIVVPSIIALNTFTKSLETEITEELKISALNSMDKLSRLMFERLADLRFLTYPSNTVVTNSDDNITLGEKVEYLRQIEKANKAYASISIYNASGIKIGDTRSIEIGVNDSGEPFYKNAANGTYYHDSVPTYSRSLGQYVIHFSGPLYNVYNNETEGVMVLKFPLNKINEIMLEAGGTISSDANIELVSDDGLLIYSNNDPKAVLQKKVTELKILDKLQNSTNRVESEIEAGVNGGGEVTDTIFIGSNEPGFLDYRGNNWSLILGISTEDAFRNVALLRNQFIVVAVIILSISTFLVFLFARSISRPIIKLRDVTNEVSKGNLGMKVDIQKSGGDELIQLSSSLENMRKTILARTEEVLRANEELKLKDRLKDEFINVAAHELRTPIQPILGLCEVLRSIIRKGSTRSSKSEEEEQLLDIIVKNAKRLRGLAQEILDVTRIESKGFDLNLESFDLVALLSNIVTDNREQISKLERNISITFEFEGEYERGGTNTIFVYADKEKITQVISNLFGNAVKFTKDGSISVKVSINKENNEAVICIKDTGQGIDPSIVPHIFTKFSSKSFEGIGLGLFIAKNIVQAHGGRIWAENNPDGKGAAFFFTLPLSPPSQS